MEREVSLEEISDGKLYGTNDMVRADSGGCEGCFACCRGMGSSIILDPLDMFRLTVNLGMTQEQLLAGPLELNVVDGIILPNIRMTGRDEACSFLNSEAGAVSIPAGPVSAASFHWEDCMRTGPSAISCKFMSVPGRTEAR